MFRTNGEILSLLAARDEENKALKNELAELRVIAGHKIELENSELHPCDSLTCVACAYSHRYSDGDCGYVLMCTKNSKCKDFIPSQK